MMVDVAQMSDEALGDDQPRRFSDELTATGMTAVNNRPHHSVTVDLLDEAFQVTVQIGPDNPRGYEVSVYVDDGSGNGDAEEVASCVYAPWGVPLVEAVVGRIRMHGRMPVTDYRSVGPLGGRT